MDEFKKYPNSGIVIAVLGSEQGLPIDYQRLPIDYVVSLQTSEGKTYELTAADYYYEALELLINESYKDKGSKQHLKLIGCIARFRYLIYATLKLFDIKSIKNKISDNLILKSKILELRNKILEISYDIMFFFEDYLNIESQKEESNFKLILQNYIKQDIQDGYEIFDEVYNNLSPTDQKQKCIYRAFNGSGCVAFAYDKDKKNNWYFSLSGSSFDYKGNNKINDWILSSEMNDAYRVVGEALKKVYKKEPIECHLTDDTRRYVLYGDIFLSSSVTLKNEVDAKNAEGLNQHYSCCERKILTYIGGGFVNPDYLKPKPSANNILKKYTFIIKYDPCKRCMPALFGCNNIITKNGNRSIVKNNNVFECKP